MRTWAGFRRCWWHFCHHHFQFWMPLVSTFVSLSLFRATTVIHRDIIRAKHLLFKKNNDTYHADTGVTLNRALVVKLIQFIVCDNIWIRKWHSPARKLTAEWLCFSITTVDVNELFHLFQHRLKDECVPLHRTQWIAFLLLLPRSEFLCCSQLELTAYYLALFIEVFPRFYEISKCWKFNTIERITFSI